MANRAQVIMKNAVFLIVDFFIQHTHIYRSKDKRRVIERLPINEIVPIGCQIFMSTEGKFHASIEKLTNNVTMRQRSQTAKPENFG